MHKGITVLSALPLYRRTVRTADGDTLHKYEKRTVTIEGGAGTGKTSFVNDLPLWVRFIDPATDAVQTPKVFALSARLVGDPPMNIVEIGQMSAAEPLLWSEMVRAIDASSQGDPSILLIDELYSLPDHYAPLFLHALAGLQAMDRVAVIATTNPASYYAESLTLYPNLAQRFGFPVRGFDEDPLFERSLEMYEAGEYKPLYLPRYIDHDQHQEIYDQLIKLMRIALKGFDLDQTHEDGKYVSSRSMVWAVQQLITASEIIRLNIERGAHADLFAVYDEWYRSGDLLPPEPVASEILQARLGRAAAKAVLSVFSRIKPFDVKEMFRILAEAVKSPDTARVAAEFAKFVDGYIEESPIKRLSQMIMVRSLRQFTAQWLMNYETIDAGGKHLKRLAAIIDAYPRVYEAIENPSDNVKMLTSAIYAYLIVANRSLVEHLSERTQNFFLPFRKSSL